MGTIITPFTDLVAAQVDYPAGLIMPAHKDQLLKFSLILSGTVQEQCGRRDVYAGPMSVVIKPPDATHTNTFGPKGTRIVSVLIPPNVRDPAGNYPFSLHNYQWFHQGPVSQFAWKIWARLKDIPTPANHELIQEDLWSLIDHLQDSHKFSSSPAPPNWLLQIKERLREEYDQGIRVEHLAHELRMHRVHLTRMFRRYFGCSISEYVQEIRTQQAAIQLAASEDSMAQIAYDNGFSDQSHLCRTFKRRMGLSPGAYRTLSKV